MNDFNNMAAITSEVSCILQMQATDIREYSLEFGYIDQRTDNCFINKQILVFCNF
jgi:hypothetical protein